MGADTKIEWAHHTWSPWIGCQKTGSPACENCYAEALMDTRLGRVEWGPHGERKLTSDAYWRTPLRWEREAAASGEQVRVFPSLCDPFDNKAPESARARFADLIRATPHLTWLLLTKRIGNAGEMLAEMFPEGTPANVWLGVTVVTQEEADRDVPKLLATPAAKRFLSIEPLMEPVDLTMLHYDGITNINALTGDHGLIMPMRGRGSRLDWIIVGGESGHDARPMHPEWARSLRDQCAAAGVPFLFKHWGEWRHAPDRAHFKEMIREPWLRVSSGAIDIRPAFMVREGKARAGRLLDGVQHDGFPAVVAGRRGSMPAGDLL